VNVVWHHFHRVDSHAVFFGGLDDQFLQAACYASAGYIATSFRIAAIPLSPEGDSFSQRHL
jgi:hypothetical protein